MNRKVGDVTTHLKTTIKPIKRGSELESLLHSEHIVVVDKMAVGGSGVARLNIGEKSVVIFIPYSAPQEKLKIKIIAAEKNFLTGEIIEVIVPSPFRKDAPCEYFGACGGCLWQHIEDSEQIAQKEQILKDLFKKFLPGAEYTLLSTISTPERFGYRNRIQLKQIDQRIGYFKRESHDIIEINGCLIAEKPIQNYIPELKTKLRPTQSLKKFEIKINQSNQVEHHPVGEFGEGLAFSQVNRFVNDLLVKKIVELVSEKNPALLTELYAGSGNFTFSLATQLPNCHINAVELSSTLTKIAVERIKSEKKHKQITFFTTKSETYCRTSAELSTQFVVLDPPRSGCDADVMAVLSVQKPQTILYISCHPVNLARDLQGLISNYKISYLQIFDMFPQTDHFETVCLLSRINP